MINFLIEWEHWDGKGGGQGKPPVKVIAPEFDWDGKIETLCQAIDNDEYRAKLRKITAKVWNKIEAETSIERRSPYA